MVKKNIKSEPNLMHLIYFSLFLPVFYLLLILGKNYLVLTLLVIIHLIFICSLFGKKEIIAEISEEGLYLNTYGKTISWEQILKWSFSPLFFSKLWMTPASFFNKSKIDFETIDGSYTIEGVNDFFVYREVKKYLKIKPRGMDPWGWLILLSFLMVPFIVIIMFRLFG